MLQVSAAADKSVDASLLEYLGSVDSEDKDWHDYLARTDIDKVAKRAPAPRAGAGAVPTPAPATPVTAPIAARTPPSPAVRPPAPLALP